MKPMPPPFWELISERVYKTDLGDDKPEVVITLMSDAAFKKFRKTKSGAKNYIDGLRILKQKLNAVEFTDTIPCGCRHDHQTGGLRTSHSIEVSPARQSASWTR